MKGPKTEEFEEVVAFVVEAVVFAGFEDTEEEEAGETEAPDHDEETGDVVAGGVDAAEGEGYDCENDKICAAWIEGSLVCIRLRRWMEMR